MNRVGYLSYRGTVIVCTMQRAIKETAQLRDMRGSFGPTDGPGMSQNIRLLPALPAKGDKREKGHLQRVFSGLTL